MFMKKLINILKEGKEKYGFLGVKAEFEAEGTRMDEMTSLSQVVRRADLNLGIKIGGCEAVSDLYHCKNFGAEYIIAPMVETPYALSKYIEAKDKVYNEEEQKSVRFLFNLETITGFNNLEGMKDVISKNNSPDGVVFGRVDFSSSLGLSRDAIANDELNKYLLESSRICKELDIDFVIGGGVAAESLDPIRKTQEIYLSRFETRKIIFDANILNDNDVDINKALEKAIEFELHWLKYKKNHYSKISTEDDSRIQMLEERFNSIF